MRVRLPNVSEPKGAEDFDRHTPHYKKSLSLLTIPEKADHQHRSPICHCIAPDSQARSVPRALLPDDRGRFEIGGNKDREPWQRTGERSSVVREIDQS